MHPLIFPKIIVSQPISKGCVVFTGGSSKGTAVVVSFPIIKTARITAGSAQMADHLALAMALQLFPTGAGH